MDAKTELERRLVGLAPGMEAEIRQVLEAYRITWAETGGALALRERIESFLAAKRIDGLSPKTLKDYGLVLRSFARNVRFLFRQFSLAKEFISETDQLFFQ